jgi:hypothetical protein
MQHGRIELDLLKAVALFMDDVRVAAKILERIPQPDDRRDGFLLA